MRLFRPSTFILLVFCVTVQKFQRSSVVELPTAVIFPPCAEILLDVLIVPTTSSAYAGALVPIPTLPPSVILIRSTVSSILLVFGGTVKKARSAD